MKKILKTTALNLLFLQSYAQIPLLEENNRWILVNNKIEKNEIYLTVYKKAKVRSNTLVLTFAQNGKVIYDYETNGKYADNANIRYLDINTNESSWAYDTLISTLTLTMQAGYVTVDDFRFGREYKIDAVNDGYILMKNKEIFYENLKTKPLVASPVKKIYSSSVAPPIVVAPKVAEPIKEFLVIKNVILSDSTQNKVVSNEKKDSVLAALPKVKVEVAVVVKEIEPEKINTPPAAVVYVPVKINYFEQNKALFDMNKRWILVRNKIERGDIYLTPYDESKLTINNLVMYLSPEGGIVYDYESDPKIKFCAGVDFLDIDTDETSWTFDGEANILTLTLKGGYASLDDFKFKRDYYVELFDDGFALRRVKEHYFNDFRKPVKSAATMQKRKK